MKRLDFSRGARLAGACIFACAAAGCTIAGQIQDNKATQTRVDEKTVELQQEEWQQQQLEEQTRVLSDDLAARQMTADQLDARLAALQKRNQQLLHVNDKKRHQREELARVLDDYRKQVHDINAANATEAATNAARLAAQQQQIDALKQRLHVRLAALAQN
jgi:septal ring factor EnvC (AmiA/AmiB activator)